MANMNGFLNAVTARDTRTENGALSNSSMGSALADQFAKAANYRGRDIREVFNDQCALWEENAETALRFIFYLRLITRRVKVNDGFVTEKVQNGQGVRDEAFKRLLWVARNHKEMLYPNLWLLPLVGSWKDLWTLMFYDENLNINAIDKEVVFELLKQGLACDEHKELIKKFLPRIKSSSKLKTDWTVITNRLAKEFATYLDMTAKEYNKFKASGIAHNFQKAICGQMYDNINWNVIPGRALNLLVNSKFLENHGLVEGYTNWLMAQPMAKYTGYVYELGVQCRGTKGWYSTYGANLPLYKKVTLDKQFKSLIETARANGKITEKVWCALDTSGSMSSRVNGSMDISALDVCTSLGVFFSTLNEGAFHKNVIMFDSTSRVKQLSGEFTDMMSQLPMNAMGGTNFQSVVDEIVRVRRENPNIPLEDYPKTLLIVSDMQFNPVNRTFNYQTRQWNDVEESNYDALKRKLNEVFPREWVDECKFIWWNVTARNSDYPTRLEDGGCYVLSGFDGSLVSMILGTEEDTKEKKTPKTMEELMNTALTQEILMQVKI